MRDIGKNIRDIRKEKSMTQDELAEKLFVTRQTLSNYENGRSKPDINMLEKISEILNVDINTLVYGKKFNNTIVNINIKRIISSFIVLPLLIFCVSALIYNLLNVSIEVTSYYIICNSFVIPLLFIFIGLCSINLVSGFIDIKRFRPELAKFIKVITISYLVSAFAILLPMNIWYISNDIRYFYFDTGAAYISTFEYIPVYSDVLFALYDLNYWFPFVYLVPGILLWFSSLPKKKLTD